MRGFDHIIPNASKWKLLIDSKDDCWACEEHMITLYIWTPKIGLFHMVQDKDEINYY